jgi:hypothetical protein
MSDAVAVAGMEFVKLAAQAADVSGDLQPQAAN